jgi:phosphatidylserine/phosphatidylglycerophosphate/cardiolipin synthase-like enzyme
MSEVPDSSSILPQYAKRVALVEDSALAELLMIEIEASLVNIRIATYLFTLDIRAAPDNPVRRMARALVDAAHRGVACRVLLGVPKDARLASLNAITSAYLRERGVRVRTLQTPPLHAKFLVADEHFSTIGSHNLTPRAMTGANELTAAVWDQDTAAELSAMFDKLWDETSGVG